MKNIKIVIFIFFISVIAGYGQQKKYITYKVTDGETIASISKKLSITPYDLMKLNPDLESSIKADDLLIIPNKDYDPAREISNVDLMVLSEKDIVVDDYIYHEVISKETLYSIQKKYNVTNDELNKLNPFLLKDGLKYGSVIKIPLQIKEEDIAQQDDNLQPYLVKPKETKYSIARSYGISIAYFEELNPKIKESGLQIDDVVLVPKMKQEDETDYTIYTVETLETLYSLSHKFEISQEELIVANPELTEGVKAGMLIKVPNKGEENTETFEDINLEGKSMNVAMMLPFMAKQDTLDFEKNRLLNITTDFYFGALLAIDSLKNRGLSVHMKVYDTENSPFISKKMSEKDEFNDYDLIIGPLFLKNLKEVSNNVKYKKPMLVSPISSQDHSGIANFNLIQEVPTSLQLAREMLEYIKSIYTEQKLVVILDEEEESDVEIKALVRELEALSKESPVTVIKPEEGYIKSEVFKENLDEKIENWFILFGNNGVIAADVINNLGTLPEEFNVTLFGVDKGRGFDKIDNNFLARINFHFPTFNYMDENSLELDRFSDKFKRAYKSYPTKYAVEGFDITFDMLMRLSDESILTEQGISKRLATRYKFIENTSNSILNNGIFIIKYEGLSLTVVK